MGWKTKSKYFEQKLQKSPKSRLSGRPGCKHRSLSHVRVALLCQVKLGPTGEAGPTKAQRFPVGVASRCLIWRSALTPGSAPTHCGQHQLRSRPVCLSHWTRLILAPPPSARARLPVNPGVPRPHIWRNWFAYQLSRRWGAAPWLGFWWVLPPQSRGPDPGLKSALESALLDLTLRSASPAETRGCGRVCASALAGTAAPGTLWPHSELGRRGCIIRGCEGKNWGPGSIQPDPKHQTLLIFQTKLCCFSFGCGQAPDSEFCSSVLRAVGGSPCCRNLSEGEK